MNSKYVIRKLVFEVTAGSQAQVVTLEEELRLALHEIMIPLIDQYCDGISEKNFVLKIDQLLIDIGSIRPAFLRQDIQQKASMRFTTRHAVRLKSPEHGTTPGLSALDALLYFLQTGLLPWNVSLPENISPVQDLLQRVIEENKSSSLGRLLSILTRGATLHRLIAHVEDQMLWTLLITSFTRQRAALHDLRVLWRRVSQPGSPTHRFFFWKNVFATFFKDPLQWKNGVESVLSIVSATKEVSVFELAEILKEKAPEEKTGQDQEKMELMIEGMKKAAPDAVYFSTVTGDALSFAVHNMLQYSSKTRRSEWLVSVQLDLLTVLFR